MRLTGRGTVEALGATGGGVLQVLALTGVVGRALAFVGVANVTVVEAAEIVTGNPIGLLLALTYTVAE